MEVATTNYRITPAAMCRIYRRMEDGMEGATSQFQNRKWQHHWLPGVGGGAILAVCAQQLISFDKFNIAGRPFR